MDNTIHLLGSRMHSLEKNLQQVAQNMANTDTAGFKRLVSKFEAVCNEEEAGPLASERIAGGWPMLRCVGLDLAQGPVRTTGRPLDVAIRGDGFLAVDTPQGPRYTRRGRMYRNSEGDLTDMAGNRYVAAGGTLRIPAQARAVSISPSGEVIADGQSLGSLLMMSIPEADKLVPEGWGLLRNDGSAAVRARDCEVVQGAIEESNVKPLQEMVSMVEVMRAYETSSNIVKRLDSLLRQLVSETT